MQKVDSHAQILLNKQEDQNKPKSLSKTVHADQKQQNMEFINKHREELDKACSAFNVDELYAFGSILTEKFNPGSDIDFIVSIRSKDPIEYAENYFNLKFELERIFKRKIDLLEQKAIRNGAFEKIINMQKTLVYARRNQGLA